MMNSRRIVTFCLLAWLANAAVWAKSPRLVVGIVIENLSGDYLHRFWQEFSPDGFRKIFEQGASTFHLSVPYAYAGYAPDYASIVTGATPSIHKIISDERATEKTAVSTLADELKAATQGRAKTIVVRQDAWAAQAKEALTNESDLLLIRLSAGADLQSALELHSAYMNLDRQLADFLKTLSTRYVPEDFLLFVVGTQTDNLTISAGADLQSAPKFSPSRVQLLLNMFLTAKYGQVQWIQRFASRQLYLNHEAIEERGFRVEGIAAAAAGFLVQLDGVQVAYTAQQLENVCGDELFVRMRRGYARGVSGDVVLALTPGWLLADEQGNPVDCAGKLSGELPFALYGNGIRSQKIRSDATILDIASTVCRRLQVGMPNGSVGKSLLEP